MDFAGCPLPPIAPWDSGIVHPPVLMSFSFLCPQIEYGAGKTRTLSALSILVGLVYVAGRACLCLYEMKAALKLIRSCMHQEDRDHHGDSLARGRTTDVPELLGSIAEVKAQVGSGMVPFRVFSQNASCMRAHAGLEGT